MNLLSKNSSHDRLECIADIKRILEQDEFRTDKITSDLLEPFTIGETIILAGKAGGRSLIVRGNAMNKHLAWE